MKKGLRILAVAMFGAAIAASAYAQTASPPAASAQGETPELRVAAFIAPPSVMEQNGTLTGFSVDLWNAIAARLKVKTSYQIVPDVGAFGRSDAIQKRRPHPRPLYNVGA